MTCPVCIEPIIEGESTYTHPDGGEKHPFHRSCILPWIVINSSCPTCRVHLSRTSIYSRYDRINIVIRTLLMNSASVTVVSFMSLYTFSQISIAMAPDFTENNPLTLIASALMAQTQLNPRPLSRPRIEQHLQTAFTFTLLSLTSIALDRPDAADILRAMTWVPLSNLAIMGTRQLLSSLNEEIQETAVGVILANTVILTTQSAIGNLPLYQVYFLITLIGTVIATAFSTLRQLS